MAAENRQNKPLRQVLRQYVLGLGVGTLAAVYGVVALLMGSTFLPGLRAQGHLITGRSGAALGAAYLLGGVYLLLRMFVEPRVRSDSSRGHLYVVQIPVLAGFIVALVYVLMHVGAVQ